MNDPEDPWQPPKRGDVVWPHQGVQREACEGIGDSGHGGGGAVPGERMRQPVHAGATQKLVRQAEHVQRPGQREQEIEQTAGIKNQGVPLREVRDAAMVERVPEREVATPKRSLVEVRQRIAENREVPDEEGLCADGDQGKRTQKQASQQQEEDSAS